MTDRPTMRLDKWLVQARFFKTRSVALAEVEGGHVRVNGVKTRKPACPVGEGDALTFPQGGRIRLIRILELPIRRGPATEAQALYRDLADTVPGAARDGE